MEIGAVIRKYRLEKHLTQEETAARLGVTAPAVNKWERGKSLPDITLLSPIARLLDISLDTLLSHTDTLSDAEAQRLVEQACQMLQREPFDAVFSWAQAQLQAYPNCDYLTLCLAQVLHSRLQLQEEGIPAPCLDFFLRCYARALDSGREDIRRAAADALYYHAMASGEYEEAEKHLSHLSRENPERKRRQAAICRETGRRDEALRMYEELLYAEYQVVQSIFQDMQHAALRDGDMERAHVLADKGSALARLFEMGEYHALSPGLEPAILEQDADALFSIVQGLLENAESIAGFADSPLYAHMQFRRPEADFCAQVRQSVLDCLQEERCQFARSDPRFAALLMQNSPLGQA